MMKLKKLIYACIMGGILFLLFGCNPRNSRAYLEKRIGTEMSRVYPTNRLEDLFEQFPDGFKLYQVYDYKENEHKYLVTIEMDGVKKGDPIRGTLILQDSNSGEKYKTIKVEYRDNKFAFDDEKEALVKEVTEVVSKHTGAPTEHIHIIIQEIKAENLGQNGKLRG